jgi:pSer/pThr/pTyr-binding forkhead associated (FHA) protein
MRGRAGFRPPPRSATLVLPAGAKESFTIGRDAACDLVLPDMTVSRSHAGLRRKAGGWLLSDVGSTNGTRLNGWRVTEPVPVRAGDEVTFGSLTLVVTDHAQRAGLAITP